MTRRPEVRVLHVTESIAGGVASHLAALWPAQADAYGAANVRFLVPADQAGALAGVPAAALVPFAARPRRAAGFAAYCRAVGRAVRAWRPDLIHAHSSFAGAAVRMLRVLGAVRCPVVYCAHGWAFERETRLAAAYEAVERALAPLAEAVVCVSKSEYLAARRIGVARRRCRLVYHGAAPAAAPAPRPPARGRIALVFVGRFDRQKGLDVLLDAFAALDSDRFALTVIGGTVLGDAAPPAAAAGVRFAGWLSAAERDAAIRDCDAVVVPSRWEGFGLVALEAMRQGRAVVASRTGGLAEVVEDGVTGRLVAPGDARALSAALSALDAATLDAWGAAGLARCRAFFPLGAMTGRLAAVYDACLEGAA